MITSICLFELYWLNVFECKFHTEHIYLPSHTIKTGNIGTLKECKIIHVWSPLIIASFPLDSFLLAPCSPSHVWKRVLPACMHGCTCRRLESRCTFYSVRNRIKSMLGICKRTNIVVTRRLAPRKLFASYYNLINSIARGLQWNPDHMNIFPTRQQNAVATYWMLANMPLQYDSIGLTISGGTV